MLVTIWRKAAPVIVTILVMTPLSLAYTAVQVKDAQRHSDQVACAAVNRVHAGFELLVAQLRVLTATSQRTQAEKDAAEEFYANLLADFPQLDCSATPIRFVTS